MRVRRRWSRSWTIVSARWTLLRGVDLSGDCPQLVPAAVGSSSATASRSRCSSGAMSSGSLMCRERSMLGRSDRLSERISSASSERYEILDGVLAKGGEAGAGELLGGWAAPLPAAALDFAAGAAGTALVASGSGQRNLL